jgi:hypothetical protein
MAKILLVNFEEEQAARLAAFLHIERHEICSEDSSLALGQFIRHIAEFDLVIVDASHREQFVRDVVSGIATQRERNGPRPGVLCICRTYRGPRFELDLERKGARVVYV